MKIDLKKLMTPDHQDEPVSPEEYATRRREFCQHMVKNGYKRLNPALFDALGDYVARKPCRGLALLGIKGIGKTCGLYFLHDHCEINIVNAEELSRAYSKGGHNELTPLAYPCYLGIHPEQPLDLIIDEVGREPNPSNYFGSPLNVMEQVFKERYTLWKLYGARTIFASNFPLESDNPGIVTLEQLYGDYIAARIKEMCEGPVLTGKDLRDPKNRMM